MVLHAPFFQHPGHGCGVVVRFQRNPIAGQGKYPAGISPSSGAAAVWFTSCRANTSGCSWQ